MSIFVTLLMLMLLDYIIFSRIFYNPLGQDISIANYWKGTV